jgi:hypothetical protein
MSELNHRRGDLRRFRSCGHPGVDIEEAQLRYLEASLGRLNSRFAAVHQEGLSSLHGGDYEGFGRCLDQEREILEEQKRLLVRFAEVTEQL